MATERQRQSGVRSLDDLRTLLSSAITNHVSAEVALLHIMDEHDFDLEVLRQILREDRIQVSFSNVKYADIASFVGLSASRQMNDIENFELHRSRMPTALFKSIVQDIDLMMAQYGPPGMHQTEQARSRFLSPIFDHIVPMFDFAFRNLPESLLESYTTNKGRVEYYFKSFGSISILFIEFKLETGTPKERLDAVAQVIAECDAGDWNNAQQGFHVPVYGILCDGNIFEIFQFDGSTTPPSFRLGCDTTVPRTGLHLPDFTRIGTTRQFVHALRPICEMIFDSMLNGYLSSLKAYHNRSVMNSTREGQSLDNWEQAVSAAEEALQIFRDAETQRQLQLIDKANELAQQGMEFLQRSLHLAPILDRPPSLYLTGWDEDEVEAI